VASSPAVDAAAKALRRRLVSATPHILGPDFVATDLPAHRLLAVLASAVRASSDPAALWLLQTSVAGVMPNREQYLRVRRLLELSAVGSEHHAILEGCAGMAASNERFAESVTIVDDAVVADVDFCARHGHNTGIQRVTRETLSRWNDEHDLTLVAWTASGRIMRSLIPDETQRVVNWTSERRLEHSVEADERAADLVVPWNSVLVLPEVSPHRVWDRLACLAEFSNNRVALIGYDSIPVTGADHVVASEVDRFVRYLSVVKHADLVAAISASTAEEFAGFAGALHAQGLPGPRVESVPLPVALASRKQAPAVAQAPGAPVVLCVGTQEPRKNQLAVLAASELLWRQGLDFELRFIGGAAMPLTIPFDIEVERLQADGRRVTVERTASDSILEAAYRDARFSVFVSLNEGYGLPIGESLAAGTPVVATGYGSMAEIAVGGGCLLVDPRDDQQIADAMRVLLTDDTRLDELRAEARGRTMRTWDDYAEQLWTSVNQREKTQ
jgi:glycosyltransferase involved in cell wall biosynthesis